MTQATLDLEPVSLTLTARLAVYFRQHPGEWIDMHTLAAIAGTGGWRSRVAELRFPPYGMRIENHVTRPRKGLTVSQYRWVP